MDIGLYNDMVYTTGWGKGEGAAGHSMFWCRGQVAYITEISPRLLLILNAVLSCYVKRIKQVLNNRYRYSIITEFNHIARSDYKIFALGMEVEPT